MDALTQELEALRLRFPSAVVAKDRKWIEFPRWQLPKGWNSETTRLRIGVPAGYPQTPPDNFFTTSALRLASGQDPGSTSIVTSEGESWRQFSYHVDPSEWSPERGDDFTTFILGVQKRLGELS